MSTTDLIKDNKKTIKFFSQRNIAIATFFGGPLAAGILVRRNFINLGQEKRGLYSILIGILTTVLIYVVIFSIPEHILDRIPNSLIPVTYTGLIWLIVEFFQGESLKKHKEENGLFYTVWKAIGIGFICLVVLILAFLGYEYFRPKDFDIDKYDQGIEQFHKNENRALELFTIIDTADTYTTTKFIHNTGIPAWKENIALISSLDTIKGLYPEFKKQNDVLIEYCSLRIEAYELISKAISESTDIYDKRIFEINDRIDELLTP